MASHAATFAGHSFRMRGIGRGLITTTSMTPANTPNVSGSGRYAEQHRSHPPPQVSIHVGRTGQTRVPRRSGTLVVIGDCFRRAYDFAARQALFGNNDETDEAETAGSGFAFTRAHATSQDFESKASRDAVASRGGRQEIRLVARAGRPLGSIRPLPPHPPRRCSPKRVGEHRSRSARVRDDASLQLPDRATARHITTPTSDALH